MNTENVNTPSQLIFTKMASILNDVGAVDKTRKNQHQGFMFRGIDEVMNELHGIFGKHQVFVVPTVVDCEVQAKTTKSGGEATHMRQRIRYTFYATDGSNLCAEVIGEAADSGDKASNKCLAIALKYVLLQTFLIPTKEDKDPDGVAVDFKESLPEKPAASEPIQKAPAQERMEAKLHAKYSDGKWKDVSIHFGKNKDAKLGGLPKRTLAWYRDEWQPKPFNGVFSDKDLELRAALDAYSVERAAEKEAGDDEPQKRLKATPDAVMADDDINF